MIKLIYENTAKNFGDELNVTLLQNFFNKKVEKGRIHTANLIMIGSMLNSITYNKLTYKNIRHKYKNPLLNIFGSGFIEPKIADKEYLLRKVRIFALRGEISKKRMEKILRKKLDNIVLGDPGLLSNRLIDRNSIEKKYTLGIIPHNYDKNSPIIAKIQDTIPNSKVLNIHDEPIDFLKKINECETIISSAMHGLIASDSFGIPNCRMILSNKIEGGDYKFNDYYSVFKESQHLKIDLLNYIDIINLKEIPNFIREKYIDKTEEIETINKKLINAFPF